VVGDEDEIGCPVTDHLIRDRNVPVARVADVERHRVILAHI